MRRLSLFIPAAMLAASISSPALSPALAAEAEDVIGPGGNCGLEPSAYSACAGYYGPYGGYYRSGYYRSGYYRRLGFYPLDAAAGVVGGAAATAGAIATARSDRRAAMTRMRWHGATILARNVTALRPPLQVPLSALTDIVTRAVNRTGAGRMQRQI
jgi:hypothetical protein